MRCFCVDLKDKDYVRYHNTEWGVPVHDDGKLWLHTGDIGYIS